MPHHNCEIKDHCYIENENNKASEQETGPQELAIKTATTTLDPGQAKDWQVLGFVSQVLAQAKIELMKRNATEKVGKVKLTKKKKKRKRKKKRRI